MAIEIEEGGQSAIVNGRQVAKAGVDPQVWKKIDLPSAAYHGL